MQRYFAKDKINNDFLLQDSDYHHIKTVMRMKENDLIEIVFEEKLYIGSINFLNNNIKINLKEECHVKSIDKPKIFVAFSLVNEQKTSLILQKCSELGVDGFIPLKTERSIIKLDDKKEEKKKIRWVNICKEACEQSKRVNLPTIYDIHTLKQLNDLQNFNKIVASTEKNIISFKKLLQSHKNCDSMIIVVGPEGGFTDTEMNFFRENKFEIASFGDLILRVETALIYGVSILKYELME